MSGEFFVVSVRQESLLAALRGYPSRLVDRLKSALSRLSIEVQSSVKGEKLSGQVLHVRTGTLRRSINREVKVVPGAVVAIVGTNVEYAAVHEYGFQGPESVRAHLREIRQAFGRPLKSPRQVQVAAHTRMVNLPERSFLRSTLKEYSDRARERIRSASIEALSG